MSAGVGTGAGTACDGSVDLKKSSAGRAWVVGSMLAVGMVLRGESLKK